MGDWPITRPLPTQDSTTQKSMNIHPFLEQDSNPMILVFEWSKTICALDHVAIGTGMLYN